MSQLWLLTAPNQDEPQVRYYPGRSQADIETSSRKTKIYLPKFSCQLPTLQNSVFHQYPPHPPAVLRCSVLSAPKCKHLSGPETARDLP
jgi:hypothetical protein